MTPENGAIAQRTFEQRAEERAPVEPRDRRRLGEAIRLKTKLLTLADLDRRGVAFKNVQRIISGIEADLGGDLTTSQKQLCQRAGLLGAMCEDLESRWLAGHAVAPEVIATLANAQRRVLATLGLERRAKPVMSLHEHLAMLERQAPPSVDDDQDDEDDEDQASQVSAQGGQEHQDDVSQLRLEDKRSEDDAA
jgi:hypothetical protein